MQITTSILANPTIGRHCIKFPSQISYGSEGSVSHASGSCWANHRPCCTPEATHGQRAEGTMPTELWTLHMAVGEEKKVDVMGLSRRVRVSTWHNIPDIANPPNLSISIYVPLSLPHSQYPHKSVRGNTNTLCVCQQWSFLVEWKSCF